MLIILFMEATNYSWVSIMFHDVRTSIQEYFFVELSLLFYSNKIYVHFFVMSFCGVDINAEVC